MRKTTISALLGAATFALAFGAAEITADMKNSTIDGVTKAMDTVYAYPQIGKQAAAALREKAGSHAYDSITDGTQFAAALTKDLNDVCKDAHLRVRYSEEALPVRKAAREPSADEIKQQQDFTRYANVGFQKVERLNGNVGLIQFRNFMDPDMAKRPIKAAMEFLKDTDALIFDIRQNGGGDPATVQLICSYLFDDKPVHLNDLVERDGKRSQYWSLKKVDGPRYLGKEVFVLVSKRTGSAAEEFSYDLQNLKRATIIGEPTWGGANPGSVIRLNDHFSAFVPVAHAENPVSKTNWEGSGVKPDVAMDPKDALNWAHKKALEDIIAKTSDLKKRENLQQVIKEIGT